MGINREKKSEQDKIASRDTQQAQSSAWQTFLSLMSTHGLFTAFKYVIGKYNPPTQSIEGPVIRPSSTKVLSQKLIMSSEQKVREDKLKAKKIEELKLSGMPLINRLEQTLNALDERLEHLSDIKSTIVDLKKDLSTLNTFRIKVQPFNADPNQPIAKNLFEHATSLVNRVESQIGKLEKIQDQRRDQIELQGITIVKTSHLEDHK